MGEIADDMINGRCCTLCGQYFIEDDQIYEHGYPVVCADCWEPDDDYERAIVGTM